MSNRAHFLRPLRSMENGPLKDENLGTYPLVPHSPIGCGLAPDWLPCYPGCSCAGFRRPCSFEEEESGNAGGMC